MKGSEDAAAAPAPPPAIRTEGLVCGYGEQAILSEVKLSLPAAAVTCVLGRSGCGKSTLMRTLLLLERPLGGSITILGQPVQDLRGEALRRFRRQTGVLFQGAALFTGMSLLENVAFPLRRQGVALEEARETALERLITVGLGAAAAKLPSEISGGMRKRAGIARALAMEPPLLFLDEPGAGLDPVTAAELDATILGLRDRLGTSIVVITHEPLSIRRIADHIVMLGGGKVLNSAPAAEAFATEEGPLHEFFNPSSSPDADAGPLSRWMPPS